MEVSCEAKELFGLIVGPHVSTGDQSGELNVHNVRVYSANLFPSNISDSQKKENTSSECTNVWGEFCSFHKMYNAIYFKMLYGNTSTEGAEPAGGDNDGSEGQMEQKEAESPCQKEIRDSQVVCSSPPVPSGAKGPR